MTAHLYPSKVTPYFASLVRDPAGSDPIALQFTPRPEEDSDTSGAQDPLNELAASPVPGLVHAYPDRALVMPTADCFVNCRHCNRRWKRLTTDAATAPDLSSHWCAYLRSHPEIDEVLVTGGDPLTLPDGPLADLLAALRAALPDVLLRLGTRAPAVLPSRITPALADMLRSFHPLYVNTQLNCLQECTPQAAEALERLADAGIAVGNQMVLLNGINDSFDTVAAVNRWLIRHRCRPYYLFLPEPVRGTRHFRVPPSLALDIARRLRASSSGLSTPLVVVDTPDAGGKIPIDSDRCRLDRGSLFVTDLRGRTVVYP